MAAQTREAPEQRPTGTLDETLKDVVCEHAQAMTPGRDKLHDFRRLSRVCGEQLRLKLLEHCQRLSRASDPVLKLFEKAERCGFVHTAESTFRDLKQ